MAATAVSALVVRILTNGLAFGLVGLLVGDGAGAAVGAIVGVVLGAVHGVCIARVGAYTSDARGWALLVVDSTWSLPNSAAGSIFLTVNLLGRNHLDHAASQGRSTVVLRRGVFAGFATTIGNVEAGTNSHIARHEYVHVVQARVFGPLYLPLVVANYVVATVLPYWLLYHDRVNRPIASVGDYFMKGVYPHVWNEEWAYRVEGSPP